MANKKKDVKDITAQKVDDQSRSVGRIVAVMDQLSVSPRPLSNLELAIALDVPVSSMHRLLRKLASIGYIDFDPEIACYSVSPKLSELGARLANVGGYSQSLRTLMSTARSETGFTISVWTPSGAHVRISALLVGNTRGPTSRLPGELAEPFSTPGLAIATQLSEIEVRKSVTTARRHHVPLGRGFKNISQVRKSIQRVVDRGFAAGFNMRGDGWGMLAWPIPISLTPLRPGCIAFGAPVSELRTKQVQLVRYVNDLRDIYLATLSKQERLDG